MGLKDIYLGGGVRKIFIGGESKIMGDNQETERAGKAMAQISTPLGIYLISPQMPALWGHHILSLPPKNIEAF